MKCIITGIAGFIGSHLADRLIKDGHEIYGIDNLSTGKILNLKNSIDKITFYNEDLRHLDICLDRIKDVDIVFHLAARARVQPSIKDPITYNQNNVQATLNVLWAAYKNNIKRVVYSASSSAYGNQDKMPLTETMIAHPQSPYALQKYIGELYCQLFTKIYILETVCLRYFNVFGPRQTTTLDGPYATIVGIFLDQKAKNKPFTIVGDGKQKRDFTYIDDIVEANIRAGLSQNVGKGEIINIGYGQNYSILELAEIIGGKDYPLKFLPGRLEPRETLADNTKCQKLLGFKPQIDIKEGIKRCMNQK